MSWIKRNLALAITGLVSLALLGFGGWYLWSARAENSRLDEEINQAKSDYELLLKGDPFPHETNIDAARREIERVNAFVAESAKLFAPAPPPLHPLTSPAFKSILQTTVAELHRRAIDAGIRLGETNYYFSFAAQREPLTFPPESLQPLYERLHDVKAITSVLFDARINQLQSIRRAPVPGETRTGNDYLNETMRLNQDAGTEIWPYEFTFLSFTPELADVLENMARLNQMALVKSLIVEPAADSGARDVPRLMGRFAVDRQQAPPVRGQPPSRAPTRQPARQPVGQPQGLKTLLEEQPLRIVMKVDVIKMAPEPPQGKQPGRPPGGGRR